MIDISPSKIILLDDDCDSYFPYRYILKEQRVNREKSQKWIEDSNKNVVENAGRI